MYSSLKQNLSNYLVPTFHGMILSKWMDILRDKNLRIEFPYLYRIVPTTLKSILNSFLTRIENQKYQPKFQQMVVEPPVFIIGHWRSGTTFLQNILANDRQFAYPNLYQVTNPQTFLISEETIVTRLFSLFVPKNRLFDNMPFGLNAPHEDEFIAWHSSGLTPCLSWNFPNASDYFDRFLSLRNCDEMEINLWQKDLITFLKKLTFKYNKPIVLKSPQHTARLKRLLTLFPKAKFIHIYRNPYRVYQSTKRLHDFVYSISSFQKVQKNKSHWRIVNQYNEMFDAFFEEKKLIPNEQMIEIKFEDFEQKPLQYLKEIYRKLELPNFEKSKNDFEKYVNSVSNHKKNSYPTLKQSLKEQIFNHWQRNFDAWGYER